MLQSVIPLDQPLTPHSCGRQPAHVLTKGRYRHHYECSACQVATAKFTRDHQAQAAWEAGQVTPQLRSV